MPDIEPYTPLETLVLTTPPREVGAFLAASTLIRESLIQAEGCTTVVALRGAKPMFLAAEGLPSVEEPISRDSPQVELPLGTYQHMNADGTSRSLSPTKEERYDIVFTNLDAAGADTNRQSLVVIDEVVGGSNICQLATYSRRYAKSRGLPLPIRVIAAEDSRANTSGVSRTPRYRRMIEGGIEDIEALVVVLPLVACDRPALLDTITITGRNTPGLESGLSVQDNAHASSIFRRLGSMARNPEIAHDSAFVQETIDQQGPLRTAAAHRVEGWLKIVLPTTVSS